ncbi:MAG: DUF4394 domain-containing protein [Acidimicrobiales bacterium]
MGRTIKTLVAATVATLAVANPAQAITIDIDAEIEAAITVGRPGGQTLFGLTRDNELIRFNSAVPSLPVRIIDVTGLARGEKLIGIDRRPKTGEMFGVGRKGTTATLYIIDTGSGAATRVATLVGAPTATSPRGGPIVLSGTEFGVDFNPVPDALRIVSNTGQNLRAIPSDRTPATGPALLAGDTFTDGALNVAAVAAVGVAAAGYTNSQVSATPPATTTLYDIDTKRDLLVIQNPPNNGTLVEVGPLGINVNAVAGFDIVGNRAFATVTRQGRRNAQLVEVDLATGAATVLGSTPFSIELRGLAG